MCSDMNIKNETNWNLRRACKSENKMYEKCFVNVRRLYEENARIKERTAGQRERCKLFKGQRGGAL